MLLVSALTAGSERKENDMTGTHPLRGHDCVCLTGMAFEDLLEHRLELARQGREAWKEAKEREEAADRL
jgi:hypothetical protein